jgi:hypothetical protein
MWRSRSGGNRTTVECIACSASVPRTKAREYDKEGDRWSRAGKEFEYLCKACHGDLCHQPREDLEALLTRIEREAAPETVDDEADATADGGDGDGRGSLPRGEFLRRYVEAVERRQGRPGGSE